MNFKNELLLRVYIVLIAIVLAALLVFGQLVRVGVIDREKWKSMGDKFSLSMMPVNAERGNIISETGAVLATSLPYYELRMDAGSPALTNAIFNKNVDSLSYYMWKYVDKSIGIGAWKNKFTAGHNSKDRFLLLSDKVDYDVYEKVKTFPIFNLGRFKGGLIALRKSRREFPYGDLARRTIGYSKETIQPVGIEGAFDNILRGEQGKRLMQKVLGGNWIPAEDIARIAPINGNDLVITIDESIQDIAHAELKNALSHHNAQYGCAIVMEVKTGKIRALVNLDKDGDTYSENFNYALGGAVEPGSTFKLASVLALLEDGYIKSVNDTILLNRGHIKYGDREMFDAHPHKIDSTSIKSAFAMSSNVGISMLVQKYYGASDNGAQFIDKLKQFRLNQMTGLEIPGEAQPIIKDAYSTKEFWSGTTLPWMSIGYELAVTPLQLLTFYNAIANDGKMMKPYLVSEVRKYNQDYVLKSFEPQILNKRIASKKSIRIVKELLEAVVDKGGTASNLASKAYKIAGKTGTSQMNYQKIKSEKAFGYRSSFVGYFPADNPMYSVIVVISEPRQNGYYGAFVSGPVFRNIADRIFSRMYDQHMAFNDDKAKDPDINKIPTVSAGYQSDMSYILDKLDMPFDHDVKTDWAKVSKSDKEIELTDKKIDGNRIPSVIGMGLRDATYLLENLGLRVEAIGCGKVRSQGIAPGTLLRKQTIRLFLG
ncbi:MAG TPA: penicillin-binding protein [Saprospiraceae bacterium]|nr:penicillin-binding protein [Saprospiraceae bacterium]